MQRIAWIIALVLLLPTATLAGDWEKLITDLELLEELMQQDEEDIQHQQFDAALEKRAELFPVIDGEESEEQSETPEEEHVTILIDGISVILEDVPTQEWFAVYIRDAAERGFVSGYKDTEGRPSGRFGPSDAVTLEQIAKMAAAAAGVDPYACTADLNNSSAEGRWSHRYVRCAEMQKWAVFSDGSVDVTRAAKRSEVVVTVLQAFGVRVSPVSGTVFTDVTRATTFGNAVETAASLGIVSGYTDDRGNPSGFFGPNDNVNRAEAAKIFSLTAKQFGEE